MGRNQDGDPLSGVSRIAEVDYGEFLGEQGVVDCKFDWARDDEVLRDWFTAQSKIRCF